MMTAKVNTSTGMKHVWHITAKDGKNCDLNCDLISTTESGFCQFLPVHFCTKQMQNNNFFGF